MGDQGVHGRTIGGAAVRKEEALQDLEREVLSYLAVHPDAKIDQRWVPTDLLDEALVRWLEKRGLLEIEVGGGEVPGARLTASGWEVLDQR